MIEWIKQTVNKIPSDYANVQLFNTLTELRPVEACLSIKLYKSGATKSKHHGSGRKLVFNAERLNRLGKIYDLSTDIQITIGKENGTHGTHRTLVLSPDKLIQDSNQEDNNNDNNLSNITDIEQPKLNQEVTIVDLNNVSQESQESQFQCYYCDFKTNSEQEYLSHGTLNHFKKPMYPTKTELEMYELKAQGRSWEHK